MHNLFYYAVYQLRLPGGSSSRTFSTAHIWTHTLYAGYLTSPSFWESPLPFSFVGSPVSWIPHLFSWFMPFWWSTSSSSFLGNKFLMTLISEHDYWKFGWGIVGGLQLSLRILKVILPWLLASSIAVEKSDI